jgi:TonB family protein
LRAHLFRNTIVIMIKASAFLVAAALTMPVLPVAAQTLASSSARIETEEALAQLLKKVDPTVPPQAVAAQAGGNVTVDIIIGFKGAVENATFVAGAAELRTAALDAVKQWTFKPFVRNGAPVRVRALVSVQFPDPKADAAHRASYARNSGASAAAQNRTMRMVGTVPCLCPGTAEMSDDVLRKMAAAIPGHVGAWLIEAFDAESLAAVYHAPLSTAQAFRIGLMSGLKRGGPPALPGSDEWGVAPIASQHWLQVSPPGMARPGTNMWDANAPWPIIVNWELNKGPISDLETVALVTFVHGEGARAAATTVTVGRLQSVQPWRIVQITSERGGFIVELQEALGERRQQHAFVKKTGVGWQVMWVE